MSEYQAPVRDMLFVLGELAGLDRIARLPGCAEMTAELAQQILEENARFSAGVLSPLNQTGDQQGSQWHDGQVTTPKGFKDAYRQFIEGGWNALQFPVEYGGQDLPKLIAAPVMEMWKSANLSFSLCPLLTTGAVEALLLTGSEEQKKIYLPRMVEGAWTGTMNLTEPQAGSDLALIKTRAERQPDGSYRIRGQKIFITYGEHDLAENIVHMVLARATDAPPGVRGISLFIVPKILVNPDGSLGERNDVQCAALEHKLGIHASPTAVMIYGEKSGALGYLVGEENHGLEYMFIMMNAARFAVGLEGVSIAERAYQRAVDYARERVQGRDLSGGHGSVPIIRHPDVRRMLMSMRAQTEAMRSLAYITAAAMDGMRRHPDKAERMKYHAFVDFMIPVVKGWCTETGVEVASTGVQVHGGMGFIEETGAAQYYRDARITTIYEGTTGIQSNDLVGRKIGREAGATAKAIVAMMREAEAALAADGERLASMRQSLGDSIKAFEDCVDWVATTYPKNPAAVHAVSVPFLMMTGTVCGGWQMARAAHAAAGHLERGEGDAKFYEAKIATARFYADHLLSRVRGLHDTVLHGAESVLAAGEDFF